MADLALICTPPDTVPAMLQSLSAHGTRAVPLKCALALAFAQLLALFRLLDGSLFRPLNCSSSTRERLPSRHKTRKHVELSCAVSLIIASLYGTGAGFKRCNKRGCDFEA